MELVYLWVERYNNIIDEEFNFSPNYKINYKTEENHLTVEKYQNEELNLFDDHFLNINAVVGKNGSGKTSLFSFFKIVFAKNKHDIWYYPFILVVKQEDGKLLLFDKSRTGNINFADNEVILTDDTQVLKDRIQSIYFANDLASFHDEDKIIPSDCFDASTLNSLRESIRESNEILFKEYDQINKQYPDPSLNDEVFEEYHGIRKSLVRWRSPFPLLYRDDVVMKLDFISKFRDQDLGLIPFYAELSFNSKFVYNNETWLRKVLSDKSFESVINILYKRSLNPAEGDLKARLKEGIILSIFLYIIRYNLYFETNCHDISTVIVKINETPEDEICKSIEEWITEVKITRPGGAFDLIQSLIIGIDKNIESLNFLEMGTSYQLYLLIDDNAKEFLEKIFKIWIDQDFVFYLHWGNVSAGESAILTLFSRIHSISKNNINKTIWLFLDESELYLHPEWQRSFFNNLHTYLPKFFGENKIQLVISSHSPFIISDIPKSNIIFLNKKADSTCEVLESKMMPETFGANIHELLASSFFMHEGVIGEFAKGKINSLITYLKSGEDTNDEWNLSSSWQLINTIGDENVKSFLIEIYNKKVSRNQDIEFLNEQIQKLQAIKAKIEGGQDD